MIEARIIEEVPAIKGYIYNNAPTIKGVIQSIMPVIKGVIEADAPFITAKIMKAVDHEQEPYYEVSNQYGTTIIIGD